MLDELVVKTPDEIKKLSESELDKYVKDCSVRIMEKIVESDTKIQAAKTNADKASNMEVGFFGKTAKKTNAVAEGLVSTNEAIAEMNDLLQEIINFVCLSLKFAQKMRESIAYMIEEGFTGRDGQFHKLTDDSKKIALRVLEESSKYAQTQLEAELKNKEQDTKIETLNSLMSKKNKIDAEQSQRIEELGAMLENKDSVDQHQEEAITQNRSDINVLKSSLQEKNILDDEQSKRISKNEEAIKILYEFMKVKNELDRAQSKYIEELKSKKAREGLSTAAVVLSTIAIVIGIINIVFQFI